MQHFPHNHSYYQTWLWKEFLCRECQSTGGRQKKQAYLEHVSCSTVLDCLPAKMQAAKKAVSAPFSVPSLWAYHIEITNHCATPDKKLSL